MLSVSRDTAHVFITVEMRHAGRKGVQTVAAKSMCAARRLASPCYRVCLMHAVISMMPNHNQVCLAAPKANISHSHNASNSHPEVELLTEMNQTPTAQCLNTE